MATSGHSQFFQGNSLQRQQEQLPLQGARFDGTVLRPLSTLRAIDERPTIIKSGSVQVGRCSGDDQLQVATCASPLYAAGVLKGSADDEHNDGSIAAAPFSLSSIGNGRAHFENMCRLYYRFDACVEPYKRRCFDEEPARSRYETASEMLEFLCREGYQDITSNFECLAMSLATGELMQCQSQMVADAKRVPDNPMLSATQKEQAVCIVLRNYAACTRRPIRYQCGGRVWAIVLELIRRPTRAILPGCDISAGSRLYSAPTIATVVAIIVYLFQ